MNYLVRFAAITFLVLISSIPVSAANEKPALSKERHEVVRLLAADLLAGLNPAEVTTPQTSSLTDRLKASAWALKQW